MYKGLMKTYKKVYKAAAIWMALVMLACFSGLGELGKVFAAGNTLTVKASQIDFSEMIFKAEQLEKDQITEVVFVLDKDIELKSFRLLENKFTKKLTVKGDHILYIKDGGSFESQVPTTIEADVKLRLGTSGGAGALMSMMGTFTSYGSITFFSGDGLYAYGDVNICGGVLSAFNTNNGINTDGNISISGGKIRFSKTFNPGLCTVSPDKSITISGGDIYVESMGPAIFSEGTINLTGGVIEAKVSKDYTEYAGLPAVVGKTINLSNKLNITKPDDGVIVDYVFSETDTKTYRAIATPMGEVAQSVYITKPIDGGDGGNVPGGDADKTVYKNEWVNGKWYGADGKQSYGETLSWYNNGSGWYVQDTSGWYPQSEWQRIDGKWYYFTAEGYMDYSEYRDGCWLGADGAWDEAYSGGHWCSDSYGWWYEDASGWYPVNQYVWIDGVNYWFGADGYWG